MDGTNSTWRGTHEVCIVLLTGRIKTLDRLSIGGHGASNSRLFRMRGDDSRTKGCRYASTPTMQHTPRGSRLRFMHYEKGSTSLYQHPLFLEQNAAPGDSITSFLPSSPPPPSLSLFLFLRLPLRLPTLYVSSFRAQFPSFSPSSRCSRCFSSPLGPTAPTPLIKTFGTCTTTATTGVFRHGPTRRWTVFRIWFINYLVLRLFFEWLTEGRTKSLIEIFALSEIIAVLI